MKTPVYQEKTFGLFHQCYLWNVMQHHWSPSLFRVLSLLLILHCWLFASRQLFHVTGTPPWFIRSSRASTSSELYPDYFLLIAFRFERAFLPGLLSWSTSDSSDSWDLLGEISNSSLISLPRMFSLTKCLYPSKNTYG